eukprot:GHRR01004267.1.p1 GENE.GHRR01004267.1~~GHRR01004267.1.p1  ORF type:complete len:293 (+),score=90.22 GHRR01004267.1:153-1031(+)
MTRLQRAVGLLRALRPCAHQVPLLTELPAAQRLRCFAHEAVAPAVTYRDIQDEWYLRQRSQISLGNRLPHVAASAWVSPSAVVVGDVDLLDRVNVWNHVVLRGDLNNITIGQVTNIQDRTVIHAARTSPSGLSAAVKIGKFVTIEPNCSLRSCRVGDFVKIGARSVLLEGSLMEDYSMLAPGSVLPPTRRVPEGELWGGVPARFICKLTEDEQDALKAEADDIRRLAWAHSAEELPVGTAWRAIEQHRKALIAAGHVAEVPLRRLKYDVRKQAENAATAALAATETGSQDIK